MQSIHRRAFLSATAAGAAGCVVSREELGCSARAAEASPADEPFRALEDDAIWDMHCHFSGVNGDTVEQRAVQLLEYADRMHVQRLIFFMGFPWSYTPEPAEFRRQNDQVLTALERRPERLLGFAYLNASFPEESLAEIERCIHNGPMVGVKLWVGRRCSALEIDPLIRRCGELNALVFQHTYLKITGNLPGESTPQDLAEMAARNPDVPLICGHTGADWTLGIRTVRQFPNVSVGISGSDPAAGFVEMAIRELGAERILYGSDIGGRSFASQLAKVYSAEMSDAQRKLILGGNVRRLLKPIMDSKGMAQ